MSRVFAYCRVSTSTQTTENQRQEIRQAGFAVQGNRIIEECISGSVSASERPGFCRLLDRMEEGDILVVTCKGSQSKSLRLAISASFGSH